MYFDETFFIFAVRKFFQGGGFFGKDGFSKTSSPIVHYIVTAAPQSG